MSIGRRDYTGGYINEAATGSRYPESFDKFVVATLFTIGNYDVYEYTVPAGYRLLLGCVKVTTDSGIFEILALFVNGVWTGGLYFTGSDAIVFPENSPLVLNAGDTLTVRISHLDEVECYYYVQIMASKEAQ
jgi:hypothetical protein